MDAQPATVDNQDADGATTQDNPPLVQHDSEEPKQDRIRFKDAIGRNFVFPFQLVKTWAVSRVRLI